MNILYLHAHDVGRFASIYGADVETPNLERFAASGATVFTNAHSVSPTCSPSRTALLTGEYPHQQNMMGLTHLGHSMSHPERHMAAWLREQGYTTALAGVQHEAKFQKPGMLPYDYEADLEWGKGTGGRDLSAAEAAAKWISEHDGSKPFFLSTGFFWPHVPLPDVDEPAEHNQVQPWPDDEPGRLDTAAFQKAMNCTDTCMGIVLEALEKSAFAEDTLVLITTDHGIPFPLNKATLHDRGTGVMYLLRVPGKEGVSRSNALVSHLDFFPTVCELTGLEPPQWLQGESLLPVLEGEDTERDALYLQTNHHVEYEPIRAVRTRSHKYIHRFTDGLLSRPNVDASRLKDYADSEGFFDAPVAEVEVYNLAEDPKELNNLSGSSDVAAELEKRMIQFMEATDDALLEQLASKSAAS